MQGTRLSQSILNKKGIFIQSLQTKKKKQKKDSERLFKQLVQ